MAPETKVPTTVAPHEANAEYPNLAPNGHGQQNGFAPAAPQIHMRADVPTFPPEDGWREVTDPQTGESHRIPLTLLDILYPTEDDIGVVYMAQGPLHELWSALLALMLRTYLDPRTWLTLHDVLIYWERDGTRPTAPDVAVFHGGQLPEPQHQSYRVGRDGPIPTFVVEITSKATRSNDLNGKPLAYAARGIREYLIIDLLTPSSKDWRLIGYRLEDSSPFYQKLAADADGGLTFATVGLRFVAVKRSHIEVYDVATGARLLTLDEQKGRADIAEQAVEVAKQEAAAEATARLEAEQKNQALEAEIARLRANQSTE